MNNKKQIFFLTIKQNNDKIEFVIYCQNYFPNIYYVKEFSLNDLQQLSKYFQLFDSVNECFADLKQKFEGNNYEMILNEINDKITLKIITNIVNKDFSLDIPIKKIEQEKTYTKFIFSNANYIDRNNDDEFSQKKFFDMFDKHLDKKLKIFKESISTKNNGNEGESEDENNQKIKRK